MSKNPNAPPVQKPTAIQSLLSKEIQSPLLMAIQLILKNKNYDMNIFMPSLKYIYDDSINFMVLFGTLDFTKETTNIDNHLYFNLPKNPELEPSYLEVIRLLSKILMIEMNKIMNLNNKIIFYVVQNIEKFVNIQNLLPDFDNLFSEFTDIKDFKSDVSIDNHFAIIIKDQGEDCKKVIIPTEIKDFDISHKFIKIIVGKKSSDANLINKIKNFLK